MDESKKDSPEELEKGGSQEAKAPGVEIEDVAWEIEDASVPESEEVPPPPVEAAEPEPVEEEEAEPEAQEAAPPEPEPAPAPEPPPPPAPKPEPVATDTDYTAEWNWKMKPSRFSPFVFDFQGQKYLFSSRGIEWIDDISGLGRYFTYLTDYPDAQGMGLLTLSTEKKYADVLARKQLEELGELTADGVLKVFEKRKIEGGQISVFYEVLPREKHIGILETYNAYSDGFIVHDTVSLLYGLLKKFGRGVHAFALHLPGAILLVAGKNGQAYLTRRYTLIGDDSQALVEGIYALEQDLVALERNLAQKISHVNWLEALTHTLNLPRPGVEIPLVAWPLNSFTLNGEQVWSALPEAVTRSSPQAALGPKEESWLRPLEQAEKWMWAVLLALAVVSLIGIFSMKGVHRDVKTQVQEMRNQMNAIEADLRSRAVNVELEDVGPALTLAKDFYQAAASPCFGEMWNYLAGLRPKQIMVDALEMNYGQNDLDVRLEGRVEMYLTSAQQLFTKYMKDLESAGFKVTSQRMDLDLEGNYYSLNLRWPLKREGG